MNGKSNISSTDFAGLKARMAKTTWRKLFYGKTLEGFFLLFFWGILNVDLTTASPPPSNKLETQFMLATNESGANTAISNAFGLGQYRRMHLYEVKKSEWDYLVKDWHPTNGFILFPLIGPITNVAVKGLIGTKNLPYVPYFHITVWPVSTNKSKVIIRTVLAKVVDGKELGIHTTWANHYRVVSPILQEETNVLKAIAREFNNEE